jgi:hypothetical protein
MSIEISNAIHAMALVSVDDNGAPIFVGQGNVGFAPFGHGPNFSEQLAPGRYRLHMLAPISILTPNQVDARGEGMIITEPLGISLSQRFPLLPPVNKVTAAVSSVSDILVETTSSPTASFAGITAFAEVTADTTISANAFTDLLTVPITLPQGGTGTLDILATAGAEATVSGTEVQFRVTLDGTPLGPGASNGASFTVSPGDDSNSAKEAVSILKRVTGVAPGDHTVKLQWRVLGMGASASILVTNGSEHGSLSVTEQGRSETDVNDNITFQVLVLRFPQQSTAPTAA